MIRRKFNEVSLLLFVLLGIVIGLSCWRQSSSFTSEKLAPRGKKETKNQSSAGIWSWSSRRDLTNPQKLQEVPKESETPIKSLRIHPDVHYPHPERIRSFSDPELEKAYSIYFSLIGRAKEDFPFARSGFDSEANLKLSLKTIRTMNYADVRDENFRTEFLAMTHLSNSALPQAKEEVQNLSENLMQKVSDEKNPSKRKLMLADLQFFLKSQSDQNISQLATYYASQRDSSVRYNIQLAMYRTLEEHLSSEEEIKSALHSYGVPFPKGPLAVLQLPPVQDKSTP